MGAPEILFTASTPDDSRRARVDDLSSSGQRVLLVEADIRRPRIDALFGIRAEPGLVDLLTGTATLEEAVVALPGHRLAVLPAGGVPTRPAEALAAKRAKRPPVRL